MILRPFTHWCDLVGSIVEVRHHGIVVGVGRVDDAMPDSSALWLAAEWSQPRSMYEAAQGFSMWVDLTRISELQRVAQNREQSLRRTNGGGRRLHRNHS